MRKDRILIEKSMIPYRFSIPLNAITFMFEIRYNAEVDLFPIGLYSGNGKLLCIEPVIYGTELFKQHYKAGVYPAMCVIPTDESGENSAVTWENFNETVFLVIDNVG